jgi:hypothetical protein
VGVAEVSEGLYFWVVEEGAEEAGVEVDVGEGLVPGDRVSEAGYVSSYALVWGVSNNVGGYLRWNFTVSEPSRLNI